MTTNICNPSWNKRIRVGLGWALVAAALATAASSPAVAGTSPVSIDRALARPTGQGHSTSSWARVDVTPPAGATTHFLDCDIVVDSEQSYDFLKIWGSPDGGASWQSLGSYSGTISRHLRFTLPVGPYAVKFEYVKDGSVHARLDIASIDRVFFSTELGPYKKLQFDDSAGSLPAGWTRGGAGGGFGVAVPLALRSAGPNPGASGTSYMQKSITFPTLIDNVCFLTYLTDTDPAHHFLKVYDGANLMASASGLNREGTLQLIFPTGGPHVLKIASEKDSAPGQGRDTVRVRNLVCSSSSQVFERHDFSGQPVGAAPTGWVVSGWAVQKATPHASFVSYLAQGKPEPVVNGMALLKAEYRAGTPVGLRRQDMANVDPTVLHLLGSSDGQKLFLGVVAGSTTLAQGSESGRVVLYVDHDRNATLLHQACSANPDAPGPADRRIAVDYSIAVGDQFASISNLTQKKGDCAGGWSDLAAGDTAYVVAAAAAEPSGSQRLSIEVSIALGAGPAGAGKVGFGYVRQTAGGAAIVERFPYRDDASNVPIDGDGYSYETLVLGPRAPVTFVASELRGDFCCFQKGQP
jgi:hypothetical protein